MASPIRVGIVGASVNRGQAWRSHVPALMALSEFEITAVCTAHEDTAQEATKATGARHAFTDYRQLVQHPDVDLVTISVRVPWHREMALAAIEAGKHVYCEWPVPVTLAEMEEMAAAARKAGVKAMAGLQARAAPSVQHLKDLIEGGYVGRPLTANARFTSGHPYARSHLDWALQRSAGNHILSIYVGHMLDIASYCLGGIEAVSAKIATTVPVWRSQETGQMIAADAPDCVMVQAQTGSGALLSAHFAHVPGPVSGWRFEVFGDEGALVGSARGPAMGQPNLIEGGRVEDKGMKEIEAPEELNRLPADYPRDTSYHVGHMYLRLADAIRSGGDFQPDFETALGLSRLLAALERSDAQDGRWLAV